MLRADRPPARRGYKLYILTVARASCVNGLPNSSTSMIDVGLQVRPPGIRGLELGAALVNAGLPLQVVNYEQADRRPPRLRFRASYDLLRAFHADTLLALRIATQVETGDPAPRTTAVSVGAAELSVARALFMRVGWGTAPSAMRGGDNRWSPLHLAA